MLKTYTVEEFSDFWGINRIEDGILFKPGYKKLFVQMYKNGDISPDDERLNKFIYVNFEELKKHSFKRRESELKYIRDKILKNPKDLEMVKLLQQEYDLKKTKLKEVTVEDVKYFLSSVKYNIRPGNEDMKGILKYVSNYSVDMVDELQDIYEQGRKIKKNIPFLKDKYEDKREFKYKWIKEDDPINLVLGIICDCCACLENGGRDIMKQSVINPDIINLALCDENNKIIGKSTAYINKEKKYVLFNNVETKEFGTKGLKSREQRQKECLQALLRAVDDLVKALKSENIDISRVAVGMHCNDLSETIIKHNLEVEYIDMLKNFPYDGYKGDANDQDYGQAILYKDDELNKEKNI